MTKVYDVNFVSCFKFLMFNRKWLEIFRFYHLQQSVFSFVILLIIEEVSDKSARAVNTVCSGVNFYFFISGSEIKNPFSHVH